MRRAIIDYLEKCSKEHVTSDELVSVLRGEYGIVATEAEVVSACADLGVEV